MSLFKQFATSESAEIEGVDVSYGANEDGSVPTFRISRMSKRNERYAKALRKAIKPHEREIELDVFSEKKAEELTLNVFVSSVLLGWSNVQDRNGKEIPYSKEAAISLFKELPELYSDLEIKASKALLFKETELENEAKN